MTNRCPRWSAVRSAVGCSSSCSSYTSRYTSAPSSGPRSNVAVERMGVGALRGTTTCTLDLPRSTSSSSTPTARGAAPTISNDSMSARATAARAMSARDRHDVDGTLRPRLVEGADRLLDGCGRTGTVGDQHDSVGAHQAGIARQCGDLGDDRGDRSRLTRPRGRCARRDQLAYAGAVDRDHGCADAQIEVDGNDELGAQRRLAGQAGTERGDDRRRRPHQLARPRRVDQASDVVPVAPTQPTRRGDTDTDPLAVDHVAVGQGAGEIVDRGEGPARGAARSAPTVVEIQPPS